MALYKLQQFFHVKLVLALRYGLWSLHVRCEAIFSYPECAARCRAKLDVVNIVVVWIFGLD